MTDERDKAIAVMGEFYTVAPLPEGQHTISGPGWTEERQRRYSELHQAVTKVIAEAAFTDAPPTDDLVDLLRRCAPFVVDYLCEIADDEEECEEARDILDELQKLGIVGTIPPEFGIELSKDNT